MKETIERIQDKFYTKPLVAAELLNLLVLDNFSLIIEPSAGSGNFIREIKKKHPALTVRGYDLNPEDKGEFGILKKDFLQENVTEPGNILSIGNPPFGKQCSLAVKFFNKCADFSEQIAFILPKSFKKLSIQNRLHKHFHLKTQLDLEEDSFEFMGKSYKVPCVFQVWEKRTEKRTDVPKVLSNSFYDFCKKDDNPHFAIQRVGSKAGKVKTYETTLNLQTHYFFKYFGDKSLTELTEKLSFLEFPTSNDTVGPKSISKQEITKKLNEKII